MRNYLATAILPTLLLLTGCSQGTPGGPGVNTTTVKKPIYGQSENTFNLSVPVMATSLQQGGTLETRIGIERAKNFGEDVSLTFGNLPKGVTLTPSSAAIRHGDADVKITIAADATAAMGEHLIKVSGHPETGKDAEIEFKLNITAADSFTLSTPMFSTSLKQNESKPVSIGISRDETFASDVSITFGDLPEGVTIQPADAIIRQNETEALVTVSAAADAALGDFTIKVNGHPTTGRDASKELKLTVVQK